MAWPSPTKAYHTTTYPAIDPGLPSLSTAGKNVVITGGGSGIGPHIAKAFAKSGASNIALLGRTKRTLARTKDEIEAEFPGTKVAAYVADITDTAALETALTSEADRVGRIQVLVANAGYLPDPKELAESTPEEWFRGFEINVKGNLNLVRAFISHSTEDATILNISTGVVHLAHLERASAYHTSKLAAAKMFDYVRAEHPSYFVLNIHPGVIETDMDAKNKAAMEKIPHDDSKWSQMLREDVVANRSAPSDSPTTRPLRRMGSKSRSSIFEWEVCVGALGCG